MAGEDDLIELKFRLADGSDIGPGKYSPDTAVASLKEKVVSQWPRDKVDGPKSINDIKLIHAGKILENSRTLADSRLPIADFPGGVMTVHVVLHHPSLDKRGGKTEEEDAKKTRCYCTIL